MFGVWCPVGLFNNDKLVTTNSQSSIPNAIVHLKKNAVSNEVNERLSNECIQTAI